MRYDIGEQNGKTTFKDESVECAKFCGAASQMATVRIFSGVVTEVMLAGGRSCYVPAIEVDKESLRLTNEWVVGQAG